MSEIDFEELSFTRLIDFYREELLQIYTGKAKMKDIFTEYKTSSFHKHGVTQRDYMNKTCKLSDRTLQKLGVT